MNRFYLLCLCGLSLVDATTRAASQELPPASQPTELITRPGEANYGKLEGGGKLLFQEIKLTALDPPWLSTLLYFPRHDDGEGLRLRHSINNLNVFLAAEIRRPRTVRAFIEDHLVHFLTHNLGDDLTTVIIQDSVDSGEAVRGYGGPRLPAAERAQRTAKLQRYVLPRNLTVTGGRWTVEANVITADGAVQYWLIKGQVSPLHIDSFLCETKEPNGTFYPLLLTR